MAQASAVAASRHAPSNCSEEACCSAQAPPTVAASAGFASFPSSTISPRLILETKDRNLEDRIFGSEERASASARDWARASALAAASEEDAEAAPCCCCCCCCAEKSAAHASAGGLPAANSEAQASPGRWLAI